MKEIKKNLENLCQLKYRLLNEIEIPEEVYRTIRDLGCNHCNGYAKCPQYSPHSYFIKKK